MRIISGLRRGHKFDGPGGRDLRPTSDMVREAIFNILREEVEDRLVVDLFAGTGAMGLEALSRGASRAIFVERERETVALIRRNVATLRFEDRSTVVATDVFRWLNSFRPPTDEPVVVFVDPPYRDFEGPSRKRMRRFLDMLTEKLPEGSLVVVESRRPLEEEGLAEPGVWSSRRYGSKAIGLFRKDGAGDPGAAGTDTEPALIDVPPPDAEAVNEVG